MPYVGIVCEGRLVSEFTTMGNTASDISEDNSIVHYLDDDVLQLVCEDLHDLVLHNKTLPTYGRPEVHDIVFYSFRR